MSRSNPTLTNPAEHFFRWSGSKGQLEFYDKEKQEAIKVPLPFEFMVLDELAVITGYSKPDKAGIWSNEVKSIRNEQFTVRVGNSVRYTGFYKNDQGAMQIPVKGAAYAASVYIAHKTRSGDYIIGNFKAAGSARSAWFDFKRGHDVEKGKIVITRGEQEEAGTGPYFPPVFKWVPTDANEDAVASDLDRELQTYLTQYLSQPKTEDDVFADGPAEDLPPATPEQIEDFERRKEAAQIKADADAAFPGDTIEGNDTVIEDIGDEPINLDDIPF